MKDIIVVNGKKYYAASGLPVEGAAVVTRTESAKFEKIHDGPQRSQTLNRKFVSQPKTQTREQIQQVQQFKRRHNYEEALKRAAEMNAAASARRRADNMPSVAHFNAGNGSTKNSISPLNEARNQASIIDIPAEVHPLQEKESAQKQQASLEKQIPSARELKVQAINEALEKADNLEKTRKKSRGISKKHFWQNRRFASLTAGTFAAILALGYLTYINLPTISTKIAASQAGIEAELPAYRPSGYKFDGLAHFDGKSVNVSYANGENSFTIKQTKSSWDSVALLTNYVSEKWDNDYLTTQEKGVTVFTNNGEAAWVNGGIVYTLDGKSGLDNEQIRKIATSFQ